MKNKKYRFWKNNILQCIRFSNEQKRFSKVGCIIHGMRLLVSKLEIPFVEYAVTTHCTLRCKYCSNLVPYFKEPRTLPLQQAKREISQLLEQVDYIYRFKVHGGEPFLYPFLAELLNWLCTQKKIGEIRISTNGTILPRPEVLQALKDSKVIVFISDYSELITPNRKKLLQILNENGVRIRDLKGQLWCDTGTVELRQRSAKAHEAVIATCMMANCKALANGWLYQCSRCANGNILGMFQEDACIMVAGDKSTVRRDLKKMYSLDHCIGCMHCDGVSSNGPFIPPAEQM